MRRKNFAMSLSKREFQRPHTGPVLDFDRLASAVREASPEIVFAVALGSGARGKLLPGSDLDLALYLDNPDQSFAAHSAVTRALDGLLPGVAVDIGVLNRAEPVYRFEAASGKLLFTRDPEAWLEFFARAAREYEYQMADYERQRQYRMEARHAR